MNVRRGILIAADSVGIDPRGHDRAESVYRDSAFLFPRGRSGDLLGLPDAPCEGALVETDVTGSARSGAIECAVTYTSIFSGQSALRRHGLSQGLALKDRVFETMIEESNLFRRFPDACLANAVFPVHLKFLGSSYVEDELPRYSREQVERDWSFRGAPIRLSGPKKNGFAELFTLAEINQNIFVHAARQAGVILRTWDDVRNGRALTSSMTGELEAQFDFAGQGGPGIPMRTPEDAAGILASLAAEHSFVFFKYQIPDLISHTGQVHLCRQVFQTLERFVAGLLRQVDHQTSVVVTSDHGHLEQAEFHRGHPKSKVPTWCFGPDAMRVAERLRHPEAIFHHFAQLPAA